MKKFKVEWQETCIKYYSSEVEAESTEEAKQLIDEAQTGIIEEDHEEVTEWSVIEITEVQHE